MQTGARLNPNLIQAIIFDIDGTLSDSDDQMVAKVEQLLRPLRFALSNEARHAAARWVVMAAESPGNFLYNMADRLSLDSFLIKQLDRASQKRKQRVKKYWIIPGVAEMLETIRAADAAGGGQCARRAQQPGFHSSIPPGTLFQGDRHFPNLRTYQTLPRSAVICCSANAAWRRRIV